MKKSKENHAEAAWVAKAEALLERLYDTRPKSPDTARIDSRETRLAMWNAWIDDYVKWAIFAHDEIFMINKVRPRLRRVVSGYIERDIAALFDQSAYHGMGEFTLSELDLRFLECASDQYSEALEAARAKEMAAQQRIALRKEA